MELDKIEQYLVKVSGGNFNIGADTGDEKTDRFLSQFTRKLRLTLGEKIIAETDDLYALLAASKKLVMATTPVEALGIVSSRLDRRLGIQALGWFDFAESKSDPLLVFDRNGKSKTVRILLDAGTVDMLERSTEKMLEAVTSSGDSGITVQMHGYDEGEFHVLLYPLISDGRLSGALALLRHRRPYEAKEKNIALSVLEFLDSSLKMMSRSAPPPENVQVKKGDGAKSLFMENIDQAVRTPLSAILGHANLLATDDYSPLTEDQKQSVAQISESGRDILSIINGLLDFSKIETGSLEISSESVELDSTIKDALSQAYEIAQDKGVTLKKSAGSESRLYVLAERSRLIQVLLNLLVNRILYSPQGGSVTIGVDEKKENGRIEILIEDFAESISDDKIEAVFEPFNNGGGVTLALSKGLINLMGGSISITSRPGEGNVFVVSLPAGGNSVLPVNNSSAIKTG